jgi:hypothetical protein
MTEGGKQASRHSEGAVPTGGVDSLALADAARSLDQESEHEEMRRAVRTFLELVFEHLEGEGRLPSAPRAQKVEDVTKQIPKYDRQ